MQEAKALCEDLLTNVREQFEEFKARAPNRGYSTGYGGERGYGDRPEGRHHNNNYGGDRGGGGYNNDRGGYGNGYNNSPAPTSGVMSPAQAAPGAGAASPSQADLTAQYAQYYAANPQADPYAAYGGYAAYLRTYFQLQNLSRFLFLRYTLEFSFSP